MAYSLEEEERMLSLFESIANQPIEQQRPYNEVRNPRPIVESSAVFDGTKVDLNSWTSDSKKVGKAKTASNPDLSKGSKAAKGTEVATKGTKDQVTENVVVSEKKEDKQVTKLVTEDASHEAKGEPKAKSGSFDSTAKSTASAQRSKAESNKKFSEESKRQRKIDMFRDFVKSLGVDAKSKADAEKVLKKFDSISKFIGEPGDGKVKPKLEATAMMEVDYGTALDDALKSDADKSAEKTKPFFNAIIKELNSLKERIFGKDEAHYFSTEVNGETDNIMVIRHNKTRIKIDEGKETESLVRIPKKVEQDRLEINLEKNGKMQSFKVPIHAYDEEDLKRVIIAIARGWTNL